MTKRLTEEQKFYNKCMRRLKNGWTLNRWRGTTPHNYWLEKPTGKYESMPIDGRDYHQLKKHTVLKEAKGRVTYGGSLFFRGASDYGQPEHEIHVYEEAND